MYQAPQAIIKQLQQTLTWVWNNEYSSMYREIWAERGLTFLPEITSLPDMQHIPIVEKRDFLRFPHPNDRLHIPREAAAFLASTTGSTTGQPFFMWRNTAGNSYYRKLVAEGASRALLLWTSYGARPANIATFAQAGLQVINVDPHQMTDAIAIASAAKVDTLITSPSLALQFGKTAAAAERERIRFIVFWGESTTAAVESTLQAAFLNAALCNAYASAETYGITLYTTQACQSPTSICHVNIDESYVEIEDGNILITTLKLPHATPLVRFKIGDQGTWYDTPCACGDANPRIQILGREGVDFVRLLGLEFHMAHLDKRLAAFQSDLSAYCEALIIQEESGGAPKARLHLNLQQLPTSRASTKELEETIALALLFMPVSTHLTIHEAVESGLMLSPTVSFIPSTVGQNKNRRLRVVTA